MRGRILGIIGRLLLLAAVLVFAYEAYRALDRGSYEVITPSELWSRLSPDSFDIFHARHPTLWDNFVDPIIRLPLWLLLVLPGLLLEYLHHLRQARLLPPAS